MKAKACAFAASAVLLATLVTGCGQSIPKTKANLALCAVLDKVLSRQESVVALADATFETSAPISQRLRQEVGQYVVDVHGIPDDVENAPNEAAKAETDCHSIGAPTAGGY
jgi:hypothetical protein